MPQRKPRRSSLSKNLLLFLVSITVGLVASEVIVRIVKPGFLGFQLPQIRHRPSPGIGFEIVPNQQGYTRGAVAQINAHGFRGPALVSQRTEEDIRILCLGDSITFGLNVPDGAPYPRQLETLLRNSHPDIGIEVINAGVMQYTTYQEIDLLKKIKELKPNIVILGVYSNDLGFRPPPENDYVKEFETQREKSMNSFREKFPWFYLTLKKSALVELVKQAIGAIMHPRDGIPLSLRKPKANSREEKLWQAMELELKTFQQLSQENDFIPIIITIPSYLQTIKEFPDSPYPNRILAFAEETGISAINALKTLKDASRNGKELYFLWDRVHLTEEGNRVVSVAIANKLNNIIAKH